MASVFELAGKYYVVAGDRIVQTYVRRLSSPFRTQGIQVRSDDSSVGRYVFSAFPLGIGWARVNRTSGRGLGGMLDSTLGTALGPVTLPRLAETQTHADPAEHFKKAVVFKGDLWGFFEEDYDNGETTGIFARKFGATSDDWTGGGTIQDGDTTATGQRVWDATVHKGSLFVLHNGINATGGASPTETMVEISSSADAASWSTASGTGFDHLVIGTAANISTNNTFDIDGGRLLSFGNLLLFASLGAVSSIVQVQSSTDSGSNWATDVAIPSGDGPKAFVDWFDLSGTRAPVMIAAEGIYSIDTSNNTFELILELDGDPANGRWARVASNGTLYVGLGTGEVLALSITSTGHLTTFTSGPGGDGLVSARQGHVNYMLPVGKWMLVAYGGHAANKDASIFMIDTQTILTDPVTGAAFNPWHHMWKDSTGNLDIVAMAYSTEDDTTPRLHFAVEGTAASINYHIEEPFVHPRQSSTVQYEASGVIRGPVDDFGDPNTTATVLQALVDADDLSATTSGEYIELRDGVDGAADTTTDRGDFLSGTKILVYGTSSEGAAAKKLGWRLTFNRDGGDTTQTPKMDEFELQARHVLIGKREWQIPIDINATATGETKPDLVADEDPHETVVKALESVATSTTLVTFKFGDMAQVRVHVPDDTPPVWSLEAALSSKNRPGYRTGTVVITIAEGV